MESIRGRFSRELLVRLGGRLVVITLLRAGVRLVAGRLVELFVRIRE